MEELDVYGTDLGLIGEKTVTPPLILLMSEIAAIGTTFNVFSYGAEQKRYVLRHGLGLYKIPVAA